MFNKSTLFHKTILKTTSKCISHHQRCLRLNVQNNNNKIVYSEIRSVAMRILFVGKGSSKGAQLMAQEWIEKIQRYTKAEEIKIKQNPKNTSQPEIQMEEEGKKVMKALQPNEYVVVLDERGKELNTMGMVDLIMTGSQQSASIAFCIGGPYGHHPEVRSRANKMVKLSSMVLNHEVARIVLLEQLYRAWTIIKGHPYHH